MGVYKMGVDEMGSRRSGMTPIVAREMLTRFLKRKTNWLCYQSATDFSGNSSRSPLHVLHFVIRQRLNLDFNNGATFTNCLR